MNAPKLKFQKPRVREGKRHVNGEPVIRFGFSPYSDNRGPGYYAITQSLGAYFVPSGKYDWQAEFICKFEQEAPRTLDAREDARRRGRFLWTSAAKQRSLAKLYLILRKDWEARCTPEIAK